MSNRQLRINLSNIIGASWLDKTHVLNIEGLEPLGPTKSASVSTVQFPEEIYRPRPTGKCTNDPRLTIWGKALNLLAYRHDN